MGQDEFLQYNPEHDNSDQYQNILHTLTSGVVSIDYAPTHIYVNLYD